MFSFHIDTQIEHESKQDKTAAKEAFDLALECLETAKTTFNEALALKPNDIYILDEKYDKANELITQVLKTNIEFYTEDSYLANKKINRLIINMPPRHTKSEFASYLLPAWMVGRNPKLKIIQATHTGELAVRFGRKAKTLIDSDDYRKIFDTTLREDSQAAGRWETAQGGEYFAAGVGSSITGRGADLLIIDDPHSEQDALNMSSMERAYEWYTSGPRQRLQPGGAIVVVMTRWNMKDLTGMLLKSQKELKSDVLPFHSVIKRTDFVFVSSSTLPYANMPLVIFFSDIH